MDTSALRIHFPIFRNNPDFIYFDSAATSQKPEVVLDAMHEYYTSYCANASRGSYDWAAKVTVKVEDVRKKVAQFLHANNEQEIVFTSGATASLNTIAYSWGLANLEDGDEVMVSLSDHQSNILPWFQIATLLEKMGKTIKIIPIKSHPSGDYSLDNIKENFSPKTKLIILSHVHSVFGIEMGIKNIRNAVGNDVLISLDASQSVSHMAVDVQDLQVDFLSFSGHKMFASTGSGVLWIHNKLHSKLRPFILGGSSSVSVDFEKKRIEEGAMPKLLEAGTLSLGEIISLGAAIDFITGIGHQQISTHLLTVSYYLLEQLQQIPDVTFLPGIAYTKCAEGHGIVSFTINGHNSSDIGFALNEKKICVRTGNHCIAQSQYDNSIRVSLQIYNTKEEIDLFIQSLKEIINEN